MLQRPRHRLCSGGHADLIVQVKGRSFQGVHPASVTRQPSMNLAKNTTSLSRRTMASLAVDVDIEDFGGDR
jgi:hypothetical protein